MLVRPVGPIAYRLPRSVGREDPGGLLAYSDVRHRPGVRLELEVLLPGGESVVFLAEVAWLEELPDGGPAAYDVALRYVHVAPADLPRLARVLADG